MPTDKFIYCWHNTITSHNNGVELYKSWDKTIYGFIMTTYDKWPLNRVYIWEKFISKQTKQYLSFLYNKSNLVEVFLGANKKPTKKIAVSNSRLHCRIVWWNKDFL